MNTDLKALYQLDPNIHFLNHGSFGACPRPVFEIYQNWQRELERQPVEFLAGDRKHNHRMAQTRQALAKYINCHPDELVYFTNPTTAMNMVIRNLDLNAGDEVLTTNHEYGAMTRTWNHKQKTCGIKIIQRPIDPPLTTHADFVERFWAGVTPNTKVIFISHITSQTALIFPVAEICRRARQAGILSLVDGAHAPGQIPLDMQAIGADFYTGACHKWLCGPKGAAFLYTRPDQQSWLDPLVVSWGYQAEHPTHSQYIDYHEWQGTRDPSAYLTVPAAIEFQAQHNWDEVRRWAHQLAIQTREAVNEIVGQPALCPPTSEWLGQMAAVQLPDIDSPALKNRLYDEFNIEIPVYLWNNKPHLRISIQAYNTTEDTDALLKALSSLIPELTAKETL